MAGQLCPHKTQLMVVSKTKHDLRKTFNKTAMASQQEIKILGVTYDSKLTFRTHIEQLARTAAGKLPFLRRISLLLDQRGRELFYKTQIRSPLEYSCFAWGGASFTHLETLDKVQRRAKRLIWDTQPGRRTSMDTLQHRQDVAGLSILYNSGSQTGGHGPLGGHIAECRGP